MSIIETNYVGIKKAAEMLSTDIDTLLIASLEHRINIWGLTYIHVKTRDGIYEDLTGLAPFVEFSLIFNPSELIKHGKTRLTELCRALEEDEKSILVDKALLFGEVDNESGFIDIDLSLVFVKCEDIKAILESNKSPCADSAPMPDLPIRKSAETNRVNKLLAIAKALLHGANISPSSRDAVARIKNWSEAAGSPVSEDTIKNYLKQIHNG